MVEMEGSDGSIFFIITWRRTSHPYPKSFLDFLKATFHINLQGYNIIKANPDLDNVADLAVKELGIPLAPSETADVIQLWQQHFHQKIIAFVNKELFKELFKEVMPFDSTAIVLGRNNRGEVLKYIEKNYTDWSQAMKVPVFENVLASMQTLPIAQLSGLNETERLYTHSKSDERLEPAPFSPIPRKLFEGMSMFVRSVYQRYAKKIADLQEKYPGRQMNASEVLQKAPNPQADSVRIVRGIDDLMTEEVMIVSRLDEQLQALRATSDQLQERIMKLSSLMPVEVQLMKAVFYKTYKAYLAFRLLSPTDLRCVRIENEKTLPFCVYLGSDFTLVAAFDMTRDLDITLKFIDSDTQREVAEPLRLTTAEFFSSKYYTIQIDEGMVEKCREQQNYMKIRYEQKKQQCGKEASSSRMPLIPQISH